MYSYNLFTLLYVLFYFVCVLCLYHERPFVLRPLSSDFGSLCSSFSDFMNEEFIQLSGLFFSFFLFYVLQVFFIFSFFYRFAFFDFIIISSTYLLYLSLLSIYCGILHCLTPVKSKLYQRTYPITSEITNVERAITRRNISAQNTMIAISQ